MTSFQRRFGLALKIILSFGLGAKTLSAAPGGYRISSYVGVGPSAKMVLIEGGSLDGIASGDLFRVYRPGHSSIKTSGVSIETGAAKAMVVYEHKTLAEITQQGTPLSEQYYPRFPEVMAGDIATLQRLEIHQVVSLTPELSLTYNSLFEDPKAVPQSFELSQSGREELTKVAEEFGKVNAGMLMVVGHTDAAGPADANQIESYQRAMVVRQYLIDQLGFDASRVTAIGKGEDDLPEGSLVPGFADKARRIVVKVVPLP